MKSHLSSRLSLKIIFYRDPVSFIKFHAILPGRHDLKYILTHIVNVIRMQFRYYKSKKASSFTTFGGKISQLNEFKICVICILHFSFKHCLELG